MAIDLLRVEPLPFQSKFLQSNKRYPALISGIGTGKTMMMLIKIFTFCEQYPNTLALVVRKEFVDLRDSTIKDFSNYFGVKIDGNKEYHFTNGSVIMFRHGDELNVLKNLNLTIFGIEQAEEFETEETFTMLRDRLRRDNAPIRQGIVIANACGHNWIWKLWINNPSDEFDGITAQTFDNPHLPKDFVADLKRMEMESPNHYKQCVLNSFEEVDADDFLLTHDVVYQSPKLNFFNPGGAKRIMAVDVARFGGDEIVYSVLESRGAVCWEQIYQECLRGKSLMETCGKIIDMRKSLDIDLIVTDDTGMGGGVTDRLDELKIEVIPFNGGELSSDPTCVNRRAQAYMKLKDYFDRGWVKIVNDRDLHEQLLSIKFKYKSDGKRIMVSKDEMRKEGLRSPDRADALCMAIYYSQMVFEDRFSLPKYGDVSADLLHPEYGLVE